MDPIAYLVGEGRVILRQAPVIFGVAVLLCFVAAYGIVRFQFVDRIDNLQSIIDRQDREIADYKNQLAAASTHTGDVAKLEKPPPVVHYDDGIYQFGVRVGSVKGARLDPVRKLLEFAALEFQGQFIAGDDFEYRDYVLKIISSDPGVQTMMTDNNSGVLQNVICRIVSGLN